jgi:predicted nucleotidyltransferase
MTGALPPPLDRIIPALIDDLRATFGDELLGVYHYGSAVSGGFDAQLSDLDLVIVTEPDVDTIDFHRIAGVVDRLARREPDWADRLDLAFVGRATLRDVRSGGRLRRRCRRDPWVHCCRPRRDA